MDNYSERRQIAHAMFIKPAASAWLMRAPIALLILWLLAFAAHAAGVDSEKTMAAESPANLRTALVSMEVEAIPESPYVQSRLRYRVRILARVPLRQATLSELTVDDASVRRIGQDLRFDVRRDGQRYRVLERLFAVIPRQPGRLIIASPRLSATVPSAALSAADALQSESDAVFERLETITRTGTTLELDVRPIPPAAESPWLAAESISISENWQPDQDRIRVGEPIRRVIVIDGAGLIGASIPELTKHQVAGFRRYPPEREVVEQASGDDLLATVTIRQTFVPTTTGLQRLPAVRLPWWSLSMDEPRQASLPERAVLVESAIGDDPAMAEAAGTDEQARMEFGRAASADAWGTQGLSVLFALAWLVTLTLWLRERHKRKAGLTAAAEGLDGNVVARATDMLILEFKRACQANDPRAARSALVAWGSACWPHCPARGPVDVIARLSAEPSALRSAIDIEQALYARDPQTWSGMDALQKILPILDCEQRSTPSGSEQLAPLYPTSP